MMGGVDSLKSYQRHADEATKRVLLVPDSIVLKKETERYFMLALLEILLITFLLGCRCESLSTTSAIRLDHCHRQPDLLDWSQWLIYLLLHFTSIGASDFFFSIQLLPLVISRSWPLLSSSTLIYQLCRSNGSRKQAQNISPAIGAAMGFVLAFLTLIRNEPAWELIFGEQISSGGYLNRSTGSRTQREDR